jgi:hypothetical protein
MNMKKGLIIILALSLSSAAAGQVRQPNRGGQAEQQLTREMERQVLEYVSKYHPERLKQLEQLRTDRPVFYRRALVRFSREMNTMNRLKQEDPERYQELLEENKLDAESLDLAQQYKDASNEAEKEAIRKKLEDLLNRIFELRQKNRQQEIERLEKRIAGLREQNAKRLDMKDEIVQRRLLQLLGEKNVLEW